MHLICPAAHLTLMNIDPVPAVQEADRDLIAGCVRGPRPLRRDHAAVPFNFHLCSKNISNITKFQYIHYIETSNKHKDDVMNNI